MLKQCSQTCLVLLPITYVLSLGRDGSLLGSRQLLSLHGLRRVP